MTGSYFDPVTYVISSSRRKIRKQFFKFDKNYKMTHTEKYIVETYLGLFERLSSMSKLELFEKLAKSLKKDNKTREKEFFKSFGAFASDKEAAEIAKEIKRSRRFREKDLKF